MYSAHIGLDSQFPLKLCVVNGDRNGNLTQTLLLTVTYTSFSRFLILNWVREWDENLHTCFRNVMDFSLTNYLTKFDGNTHLNE